MPRKISGRSPRISTRRRSCCGRWRSCRISTEHCVTSSLVRFLSYFTSRKHVAHFSQTGNYRSCTLDCAATLKLNPKNVKAFYRSSMALLKLDKADEAED